MKLSAGLENRKIRFVLVGGLNTLFNFVILDAAFYGLKQSKLVSSFIATSFAIVLSFFLNRGFVFRHKQLSWRQPVLFIIVTVSGVLLIQNSIYYAGIHLLSNHTEWLIRLIHSFVGITLSKNFVLVNLSNVFGSLGALAWNYNGYRLFVFKGHNKDVIEEIDLPA